MEMSYLRKVGFGCLKSEFSLERWKFVYCIDGNTWKGELGEADIISSAAELSQDLAEYTKVAIQVFSGAECRDLEIDVMDCENDTKELNWKKITSTNVKYSIGSVTLQKSNSSEVNNILRYATDTITELKNELKQSHLARSKIEAENTTLFNRMEDFSKIKIELEGELFAKFVLILNEKKSRIRELKNELENLKSEKKSSASPVKRAVNNNKNSENNMKEQFVENEPLSKKHKSVFENKVISHDDSLTGESEELIRNIPLRKRKEQQIFLPETPSTSCQIVSKKEELCNPKAPDKNVVSESDDTVDASDMLDQL